MISAFRWEVLPSRSKSMGPTRTYDISTFEHQISDCPLRKHRIPRGTVLIKHPVNSINLQDNFEIMGKDILSYISIINQFL
jgi:hypothetical protein